MPALQRDSLEPLWEAFKAHIPAREVHHPNGGHRPRVSDRIVFEKLVEMAVFGLSYRQAEDHTCSATTIRRRRDEWIKAGVFDKTCAESVRGYDKMVGLDFSNLSVDGCIVKAPNGGEAAGRSPVDRGKGGMKRSLIVEGNGIPVGCVITSANRHDSPFLRPTLETLAPFADLLPEQITIHLDAGYDSQKTRDLMHEYGLDAIISQKGTPLQAGERWKVERTHSWMNNFRKLAVCRERRIKVIDAWVQLVSAIIVVKKLVIEGWSRHRWDGRPTKWKSAWGRSLDRRIKRRAKESRGPSNENHGPALPR